ncbi:hypothetical protein NDA16_001177 [Ustilago loliicola]|nr:hypothetical protein NDA16_001177 [Ustilago loliicola]
MPASQQSSSSRLTEAVAASAPASEKYRRTLIVPGQGRDQDNEVRQTARSSSASGPQGQQKKTFDIQPASPKSAAGGTVDVDMADARPSSRSPPLPALTVARNRPTTTYAVPVSEPRREVNFPPHTPILQYPYEGIGAVTVLVSDFDRLQDGQLLNDTVIEFGLKFIHGCIRDRDPDLVDSIHIFNTFFYKLLSATTVENSYRKLRKWTTKVDLFSKKYIVVPINEDYHWYLALIVNPYFMLMEQDQDNGSASEQDKEEVASALTAAPKASPSPPGPSAAPAKEDVQDVVEDADLEQHREAKSAPSSEPGTPPLPKLQLPLRSSQANAGSATVPMDVDADSHAGKPSESAPEPVDLNRTFVITFDSLGSKHLKVKNKLHEYLWREALDKKRLSLDDLAKRMAKQEAEQAARREAEKPQTRAKEAAQKDEADDAADVSMDEAMDGATEATNAGKRKNAGVDEGSVRKIQIQDTRRVTGSDGAKPMDEETLAKYLPKTAYVHAQVPTQPNFCDCGIYLLHYVDRFFGDPEKFLELVVAAAEKKTSVGKATFAIRQKVREEAEKSFESEWQAGEVSGKRKHWRQSILNLREGWISYQNSKKAAETDDKRLGKEQAASVESSQVVENAAQQKPDTQESGTDVAMPLAVPVVSASEQEQQGKGKGKETADVSHQDSQKAQSQLSDLQLHLLPISTQGNEPGGSTSVDNVVALAQSLTGNVDSEVQQRLLQAQREGEEPIQASEAKSPALWLDRIINPSGHAATASASTANHGAAHQLLLSGPQLPIAPFNPKEDEPGSPTITSSSNASPRREQQQQQQHRVSPPPQPSFGSSIQDPSTGTSGSTAELRDMLQPTETFGSGILYQNNHRQLHDGVDVSSNRSSSDAGSDSSAFVVDIVGPSPSPSSSAAADQS